MLALFRIYGRCVPQFGSARSKSVRAASTVAPKWPIWLTAFAGAWVGHFLEYVRVDGWHGGLAEMSSSAHTYFFPAGAALTALGVGGILYARRVWAHLGRRLRRAESALWRGPTNMATLPTSEVGRQVGLIPLWLALSGLQVCTWVLQENLETLSADHRAPLLGVITGVHQLAPVVQASVAFILAVTYELAHRLFAQRGSRIVVLERAVNRKWGRSTPRLSWTCKPARADRTPLERWGAQCWQRPPPPAGAIAV